MYNFTLKELMELQQFAKQHGLPFNKDKTTLLALKAMKGSMRTTNSRGKIV